MFYHKKSKTLFDVNYELRYSKDFGNTWLNLVLQNNLYFDKMVELEDGSIIGLTNNKAYKSEDDGMSFTEDSSYVLKNINYLGYDNIISKSKKDELVICNIQNSYYLDNMEFSITFQMPSQESDVYEINQFG